MANQKVKLELTWIGKDDAQEPLEPRILIENPQYSYGTVEETTLPSGKPWHGNMLIHGDNLLALKSLVSMYAGEVKCIYIDPPYNTGNAFEHYDDNLEHSIWLGLMYKRIELLYALLREDGVFCMHLDDDEVHYAKVICDEIFGRKNFMCTVAIKSSTPSGLKTTHKDKKIIKTKDLVLIYKKSDAVRINPLYVSRGQWDSHFSKILDKETLEVKNLIDVLIENEIFPEGTSNSSIAITPAFKKFYQLHRDKIFQTQPVMPIEHKSASLAQPNSVYTYIDSDGNMNYALNGRRFSFLSNSMSELEDESFDFATLLCDFWSDIDFQNTQNEGGNSFPAGKKPEKLLFRIIKMFTSPGDIVLDSFLGSGTTVAVAHKMGRKYIGVELGNQAISHSYPRLRNIISNEDSSGVTELVNWQGGGGFKFYELAPSLLKEDEFGQMIINPEYNADQLAAAMAMQEGYTYQPDKDTYWKQGYGSEHDYIFTTTQFLTAETIDRIHETMGEEESLLICCTAYQKEVKTRHGNITVKKIPKMLLGRCAFDKDNYNLNIVAAPEMDDIEDEPEDEANA